VEFEPKKDLTSLQVIENSLLDVPSLPRLSMCITQNCPNAKGYSTARESKGWRSSSHGQEYRPPDSFRGVKLNWQQYEVYVCGSLERMLPDAKITKDVHVKD
jgi:hypothetical protein